MLAVMNNRHSFLKTSGVLVASVCAAMAAQVELAVDAAKPGPRISPTLYGLFFEDINLGADGGLCAELVKNRAFEFPNGLMGWSEIKKGGAKGSLAVLDQAPYSPNNPHFLRMTVEAAGDGFGTANEGFRGMGIRKGAAYVFSVAARSPGAAPKAVKARIVAADGRLLGETVVDGFGASWEKKTGTIPALDTDQKAHLELILDTPGSVDLDMVSLCPQETWKNRPNGLRADAVQALADMKPGFLRFPGGCIVEGNCLSNRYQWKTTLGALEDRKLIVNRWNFEFKHRLTPDYFQTFNLGFFEYFQTCEDIGAEPLPIINCGMACQFNTGELVPLDQLDPYVQDMLDLIEFANGPATSPWGAKRAALGHAQPFGLKILGVGNEQWGPQYIERLARVARILKEKHPEIRLVCSAGPSPADDRFNFLWPKLRELKADIVDEHCYAMPDWFLASATRFDGYDRKGPKVFMGEYAAQSVATCSPANRNNLICALSEAAFMTGLERNSDVVVMSSYAPLFGHEEGWQWRPNLIWMDNLRVAPTPNYHVQRLFNLNRGDVVLPVQLTDKRPAAPAAGRIGLSTYNTAAEFKDIQVTRNGDTLFRANLSAAVQPWTTNGGQWTVKDGAWLQTDSKTSAKILAGDVAWTDYTVSLKARKLSGSEGFIVIFRNGVGGSALQWNLGGWGNKQHGLQSDVAGKESIIGQVPGSIETNRWYDVRIELKGTLVNGYLDGRLVQTASIPVPDIPRLFATASRDEKSSQILLKVVNPTLEPADAALRLSGTGALASTAQATVLTGGPDDINTMDKPAAVAPVTSKLEGVGPEFQHTFPPYSLTILRMDEKK
jgi:alpha-L-arabinofuranosidase